jgi:CrcB protein
MMWLAVAVGGALGSVARYAVSEIMWRTAPQYAVPYATLIVNLAGCLGIGVVAGMLGAERLDWSPATRAFVLMGLLGGFTTFSSFGLDTHTLVHAGRIDTALWNAAGQLILGMLAVAAGFAAGAAGRL